MYNIHSLIEKYQHQSPFRETTYEWDAIEFGYYALLTSVLHLNQRLVQDRSSRENCLRASRQSLIRLGRMQDDVSMDANFFDEYPYFLTWTLLFYPLSPFFVLFCNVVCSANLDDYALMTTVTKGLSRFRERHPSIAEVHKLFSAFLGLVGPLVHNHPLSQPTTSETAFPEIFTDTITNLVTQFSPATIDHSVGSNPAHEDGANLQDQVALDNELMWGLLDSQPWMGWIRSDALTDIRHFS